MSQRGFWISSATPWTHRAEVLPFKYDVSCLDSIHGGACPVAGTKKASPHFAERPLNLPVFALGLVASSWLLTFSMAEDEAIRSYFLILIIRIVVSVTTVKLPMSSARFVLNSFSNTSILCQLLSLDNRNKIIPIWFRFSLNTIYPKSLSFVMMIQPLLMAIVRMSMFLLPL